MWLPDDGFMWNETCLSSFYEYNFNYLNNLRLLQFVCISWKIKCLILLMHGATMNSDHNVPPGLFEIRNISTSLTVQKVRKSQTWPTPIFMNDRRNGCNDLLTLILRRSRAGTVWFYTSTSNKRAARPKLYTKSLTRDLKRWEFPLTFRHRASCILGQAFHYSPKNAFYIFNQLIYFIIWYLLDRASLI